MKQLSSILRAQSGPGASGKGEKKTKKEEKGKEKKRHPFPLALSPRHPNLKSCLS